MSKNLVTNLIHKLLEKIFFLIFFILFLICFSHNVFSAELDNLFLKLKQSKNTVLARDYENKIWKLWLNSGSSETSNTQMKLGINLLNKGKLDQALLLFENLSKKEPMRAETFNKIATIKFLKGDYKNSKINIYYTLKLEPRHFGAISGLIQINIIEKKYEKAFKNIENVLKIHPFIGIKNLEPYLKQLLKKSFI